ncbi:MAG: carbamoyltransferase HypF [bacterium]
MQKRKRTRVKVKGVVQGVGFRPFVYRLARDSNLKGYVRNTTNGVDIEVEGSEKNIAGFVTKLQTQNPRASRIETLEVIHLTSKLYKHFTIRKSKVGKGFTQISPDIATCRYCLIEFNDHQDRRYKFPFINCTNCGPRYSIIHKTPYDRKHTSMKYFSMCQDCAAEFRDVMDRRFHAQPDCCADCGPRLSLYTRTGTKVRCNDPVGRTAELLNQGKIIAIKGLGGFHIACDATNKRAVCRLRSLKNRPTKPFAIMTKPGDLSKIIDISAQEKEVINSPIAPIILVRKKKSIICDAVAPNNPYLGVMVPYTPVHYLLLEHIPYLVMTSANIQDEPIITEDNDIIGKLGHIVTHYLTHDRAILNRCDDSVGFHLVNKGFSIMRRSRGYAPAHIDLPCVVRPSLAVGPYLKNTFTLAKQNEAYVSPHIGDLNNRETMVFFKDMVRKYKNWFHIEPELIIHDLHPDYLSTKIARTMKGKKIGVQHHIAHVVSCLGEHGISERAIGIAFDGTGYGTDGKIWGSEFFIGDLNTQKRAAHLEYLPLPGGETSILKPYRIALAYVIKLLGSRALSFTKSILHKASAQEIKVISKMLDQDRNVVYTSSMGRLFDSVAALLGLIHEITYEAEGAINLEYAARSGVRTYYPYVLEPTEPMVIKIMPLFEALINDIKKGIAKGVIAAKFHNTIAAFTLDVTEKLSKLYRVKKVCLSGGVFQNRYLLNLIVAKFEKAGFKVFFHKKLPTNDGCISYGQTIYANSAGRRT